jgi:hypothetical protein
MVESNTSSRGYEGGNRRVYFEKQAIEQDQSNLGPLRPTSARRYDIGSDLASSDTRRPRRAKHQGSRKEMEGRCGAKSRTIAMVAKPKGDVPGTRIL